MLNRGRTGVDTTYGCKKFDRHGIMEGVIAREKSLHYIPKLLPIPKGRRSAGVYFACASDRQKWGGRELEMAKVMVKFGYDVKFMNGACWWNHRKWKLMDDMRRLEKYGRVVLDTRRMAEGTLQVARLVHDKVAGGETKCKEVWVLGEGYYCVVREDRG